MSDTFLGVFCTIFGRFLYDLGPTMGASRKGPSWSYLEAILCHSLAAGGGRREGTRGRGNDCGSFTKSWVFPGQYCPAPGSPMGHSYNFQTHLGTSRGHLEGRLKHSSAKQSRRRYKRESNTKSVRLQRRVRHIATAHNTKSVRVERKKRHVTKENNTKSVRVETTIRLVTQ